MSARKHLIVGDGDFSYSVSLLEAFSEQDFITSCIESENVLYQKYKDSSKNVEIITKKKSE